MSKNNIKNNNYGVILSNVIKKDKEIGSIISKFQKLDNAKGSENTLSAIDYPLLKRHSDKNNEKTKSSDDILALFPDADVAREILIGSIVAPNTFKSTSLTYTLPNDFPLLEVVKKDISNVIKTHVEKYYKLEYKLKDILRTALFEKGSYAEVFIPEASLDDAINNYQQGTESYSMYHSDEKKTKNINVSLSGDTYQDLSKELDGFKAGKLSFDTVETEINAFGKPSKASYDCLKIDNTVLKLPKITEDLSLLRNIESDLKQAAKNVRLKSGNLSYVHIDNEGNVSYTSESKLDSITEEEGHILNFLDLFSKNPDMVNKKNNDDKKDDSLLYIKNIDEASRKSIGRPLVLKLNSESIIPIHSPYDKSDHIGYFLLLDEEGKILEYNNEQDSYLPESNEFAPVQVGTVDPTSFISQGRRNTEAMSKDMNSLAINEELFTNIVHSMISKKLKKGAFKDLVQFNKKSNQLIYKLMFFRALKNRGTQMLFLPADLVTYFAYDYRNDGTGRSLLEKTAFLYSLRAILMMTTMNATLINASNVEEINVDLDEHITNVEEILAQIQEAVIQNRSMSFPIGITNPLTLQDIIARSGFKFNVNSARLPSVNISVSDSSRNVTIPDESIDEKLNDAILLSMGITPEMVKQAKEVDFATVANSRQMLFDARTTLLRERTDELISLYVRKAIKNDEELRRKIEERLAANFQILSAFIAKNINKKDETNDGFTISQSSFAFYMNKALEAFEEGVEVKLPRSELEDGGPAMKELNARFGNIDSVVDQLFNSDLMSSELIGETLSNKSQLVTSLLKTALKRNWVMENNALPDLVELLKPMTAETDRTTNAFTGVISDLEAVWEQFATAYSFRKTLEPVSDTVKGLDEEENSDSWGSGGGGYDSGSSYGSDNNDDSGDSGDSSGDSDGDDPFGGSDDDSGDGDGADGGTDGGDGDNPDGGENDNDDGDKDDDNPTKGSDDEIDGWI